MNIRKAISIFACTVISNLLLSSCGGRSGDISGVAAVPNPSVGISILNTAPSSICSNGGITVLAGINANGGLVLSPSQVTSTQFVCIGTNGINGKNDLLSITSEPSGSNCLNGGSQVSVGLDQNGNEVLDKSEVTSFNYICNGTNAASGTNVINGVNGANGLTTLSKSITEVSGLNCPYGGIKITSGLDINANLVLDANEVVSSTYVCNGISGSNGNNGNNGVNGKSGINTLLVVAPEPIGVNCLFGGTKTTSGLDSNSDGILELSEITSTPLYATALTVPMEPMV